jgi:hypothetical protein
MRSGSRIRRPYLFRTAMNVFRNRYQRSVLALRKTLNIAPSNDAFANVDDRDLLVRSLRELAGSARRRAPDRLRRRLSSEEAGKMFAMRASTVQHHADTWREKRQCVDSLISPRSLHAEADGNRTRLRALARTPVSKFEETRPATSGAVLGHAFAQVTPRRRSHSVRGWPAPSCRKC